MNAKNLDRYKQLLLPKRRELLAATLGPLHPSGGTAGHPGDLTDQATEASETALQVSLRQKDSHLLRAIEGALARIEQDTFGVCETCKRPISTARLDVVPWTRLCRDCKEQRQA